MDAPKKVGRPTKYSQEILDKTEYYIQNYKSDEFEEVIPSVEGLSCYLKIRRSTLYDWKGQDDKESFSDMLDELISIQGRVLMNKGLSGEFNSNITKLVLSKHGYHDKSETDVTTGGEKIELSNTERKAKLSGILSKAMKRKDESSGD